MNQIVQDFVTLFNCLWYRDFPVTETHDTAGRTDWTIHLGLVVRQSATLLGARALFEQGGRTDAVLRFSDDSILSFVEWEWEDANTDINEIHKLLQRSQDARFCTFVGYCSEVQLDTALGRTRAIWEDAHAPLLFFVVTYQPRGNVRRFRELQTYLFQDGRFELIRTRPALPWEADATLDSTESAC